MADTIAGSADYSPDGGKIPIFHCTSEDVHAAITPAGTWQWMDDDAVFHGSLRKCAQQHHFHQYTKKRDMKHIYANEPIRWTKYSTSLLATLTKINPMDFFDFNFGIMFFCNK